MIPSGDVATMRKPRPAFRIACLAVAGVGRQFALAQRLPAHPFELHRPASRDGRVSAVSSFRCSTWPRRVEHLAEIWIRLPLRYTFISCGTQTNPRAGGIRRRRSTSAPAATAQNSWGARGRWLQPLGCHCSPYRAGSRSSPPEKTMPSSRSSSDPIASLTHAIGNQQCAPRPPSRAAAGYAQGNSYSPRPLRCVHGDADHRPRHMRPGFPPPLVLLVHSCRRRGSSALKTENRTLKTSLRASPAILPPKCRF